MVRRLAHVGLTVSNLETMLDFYTRVIGLDVDAQAPHPRGGTIVFLKASGGEVFEMIHYATPKAHEGRDRLRTGLHHVGLLVDDVRREVRRLKELGVELDGDIKVNTDGDLVIHFWDPDGNRVHLTERQ